MRPLILPLVLLGVLAPGVRADEKTLLEQPLSEYKARRQALMKRVKEADSGAALYAPAAATARPRGRGGRRAP